MTRNNWNKRTLNTDEPLVRIGFDGTKEFYHADMLGSIMAITDEDGNVKTQYKYSPFGESTLVGEQSDNPFRYTAREYDATGLMNYRHRYYNPRLGRFISEDPIGLAGGINLYSYVHNRPMIALDPLGLDWLSNTSDFAAGFGDTLSFGLTNQLRDVGGFNDVVNSNSSWYTGGEISGLAYSIAIGGAGGLEAAGAKAAGMEFSHLIPARLGGPRSPWNGNYMTIAEHALSDPYRYRFMSKSWKAINPMQSKFTQLWNRFPALLKGLMSGGAYGSASVSCRQ